MRAFRAAALVALSLSFGLAHAQAWPGKPIRVVVTFRTGGAPDILPQHLPQDLLSAWRSDPAAARAGHEADRSAIYGGFHVYRRRAA